MHDRRTPLESAYDKLRFLNDALLIPVFTTVVLETATSVTAGEHDLFEMSNLGFCISFLAEWAIGLVLAPSRWAYLRSPARLADLVSSIPLGHMFQSLRLVRAIRVMRLLRVIWRARRYRHLGGRALQALVVAACILFAGALAIQIVEPSTFGDMGTSLWWAVVTMSTVGYGDTVPSSTAGRLITSLLIVFGVGVFGYVAGFMASVIADPEEDEILAICQRLEAKVGDLQKEVAVLAGAEVSGSAR